MPACLPATSVINPPCSPLLCLSLSPPLVSVVKNWLSPQFSQSSCHTSQFTPINEIISSMRKECHLNLLRINMSAASSSKKIRIHQRREEEKKPIASMAVEYQK